MNRCLKLSVLSALALASGQVLAMDLGQIQVKSALDKPLLAEIPLTQDYPGEADFLKVALAPADAFARAGIRRDDLKVPLQFDVVTHSDGHKVIRVTSSQPVHEPYLDFLIQVSWPKGKLLREYTVLLDPLNNGSAPRTTATAPTAGSDRSQTTQTASTPAPAPAPRQTASNGEYGPVQHGDTLSHIALANKIDGVSYQQMLVALKAANPDAFFKDNVNALKSGAVLRIPTRDEATATSRAAALAAVREQNHTWQNQRAPTMVASAGGSDKPVDAGNGRADGGDRLSLVPPDDKGGASAGAASGNADASARELRQQLARSKEALSSQEQAADDLKSRVEALEQLEQKNKRLLSLKNAEIAELGEKLADARKQAGLPALPASSALAKAVPAVAGSAAAGHGDDVASVIDAESGEVMTGAASAASAQDTTTAAAQPASDASAATAAVTTPAKTTPAAPAHASDTPWYKQLWAQLVLILVIIGLLLWALLRRRRGGPATDGSRLSDQFGQSPLADGGTAAAVAADDDADAAFDGDDDGESELLTQLAADPENIGLHLELASLYYARGDADRFEAIAESMHNYLDDEDQPEWAEVRHMGRELVPDHPLFADTDDVPGTPEADMAPVDDDLDLDPDGQASADIADDTVSDPAIAPFDDDAVDHDMPDTFGGEADERPASSNGYSFDFNLIPENGSASDAPAETGSDAGNQVQTDGLPSEADFDNLPPLDAAADIGPSSEDVVDDAAPAPTPEAPAASEPLSLSDDADEGLDFGEDLPEEDAGFTGEDDAAADFARDGFSDDPVDTKLDLARAYIDMGDAESARAMLNEAVNEGSQMQQDVARKLLDGLA